VAAIVPLADSESRLRHLRELIGDRRIVLLGENGHGVGELTQLRAALTETLLESMGFTTVIFESGYHECDEADAALASVSPTSSRYAAAR
jgi:erythromycin esterase-like protein